MFISMPQGIVRLALSKGILTEGKAAVDRYLQFYRPAALITCWQSCKAGVDMTSKEPIAAACQVFAEKLDEFARLAGRA